MTSAGQRRSTVCFVAPSLAGGGAERVAVQVLNALDGTRWDRCLYLFEHRGPYLADLSASIRVEASDAASRIGQWRHLRRFLHHARPDVVVAFLSYVSVLTAARAARVGVRSRGRLRKVRRWRSSLGDDRGPRYAPNRPGR